MVNRIAHFMFRVLGISAGGVMLVACSQGDRLSEQTKSALLVEKAWTVAQVAPGVHVVHDTSVGCEYVLTDEGITPRYYMGYGGNPHVVCPGRSMAGYLTYSDYKIFRRFAHYLTEQGVDPDAATEDEFLEHRAAAQQDGRIFDSMWPEPASLFAAESTQ